MKKPFYLTIDQGGHASRAALYTVDGELVNRAAISIKTHRPAPEYVEHDPEEVVLSIRTAVDAAIGEADVSAIVAAGLATQRSSVVCWDSHTGMALSPIISWQDRRTAGELEQLVSHTADIRQRTGLPLSPHYGASKLRWCWQHLPAVREAWQAGHLAWGPLASFLTFRLTQERALAADPANASRTLLWNLGSGDWDDQLARLFDIPIQALPPSVDSDYNWGHLIHNRNRIPLTLVTGDQSAALFAFAESASGALMINVGTGAFMQLALSQRPPPSRLLTSLAYQGQKQRIYALEGTVNGAASALNWITAKLGLDEAAIINHLPQWLQDCRHPPLFLNGVSGLGTPYLEPLFASRFIGDGSVAEKMVAVCESIIFLLRVNHEEMANTAGSPSQIIISGGLANLDGLCQRLADLSGLPVLRPRDHEATAQGLLGLLTRNHPPATGDRIHARFLPRHDAMLEARYRAWRAALEDAVIK